MIYIVIPYMQQLIQKYNNIIAQIKNQPESIYDTMIYALKLIERMFSNPSKNSQQLQFDQQNSMSINDVIKQSYQKIMKQQNMRIVHSMLQIDCFQSEDILQPYSYIIATGGKKIRLIMAVIISQMFIPPIHRTIPQPILMVGGLIQLLHSASLIIDDIQDSSQHRRGKPCSHLVYGLDRSINAANLMYFLPFKKLYESIEDPEKRLKIFTIFIDEMTVSHMGQAQDVIVHKLNDSQNLPSFEEYETLTIAKTSSLLRMMAKMLCVLLNRSQNQSEKLSEVMNYIGLAFQVTDDILNLTKNLGKGDIAEDLREKKFTPIIHYMRDNKTFMNLFIKDFKDEETIKQMLSMILQSSALQKTTKLAEKYRKIAEELIQNMETPYPKIKFEKLMKFIVTRQS